MKLIFMKATTNDEFKSVDYVFFPWNEEAQHKIAARINVRLNSDEVPTMIEWNWDFNAIEYKDVNINKEIFWNQTETVGFVDLDETCGSLMCCNDIDTLRMKTYPSSDYFCLTAYFEGGGEEVFSQDVTIMEIMEHEKAFDARAL